MRFLYTKINIMAISLIGALINSNNAIAGFIDLDAYDNVLYVSSTGSDANTGSKSDPFATVQQAILSASQTGDMISIGAGSFDITNTGVSGWLNTGLNNDGKDVDFAGTFGQTTLTIDGVSDTSRDVHFYSGKGFSKIYDMKFVRNNNNRRQNYNSAFFGYGAVKGEFYNTVFKSLDANSNSMTYDNTNKLDIKVFNSVFDVARDFSNSYSGTNAVIVDSISNRNFRTGDGNTYTNSLQYMTFDENYNITSDPGVWQSKGSGNAPDGSQADIGLYQSSSTFSSSAVAVPAPSGIALMLSGVFGLFFARRKT